MMLTSKNSKINTSHQKRVFFITLFPSRGPRGGPGRVVLQLLLANKENKLIPNIYGIFSDTVFSPDSVLPDNYSPGKRGLLLLKLKRIIKPYIPKPLLVSRWLFAMRRKMKKASAYYRQMNKQFLFSEDDVFIVHDHFAAFSFIKEFPDIPILTVYHHQGSLYNNFVVNNGVNNHRHKRFLDNVQKFVLSNSRFIGFPSKGALNALRDTAPDVLGNRIDETVLIFYNGVDCPPVNNYADNFRFDFLRRSETAIKFATVAALIEAKGVVRVPRFLGTLKKHGISFVWVVVGDGPKAEILRDEIIRHNIRDDTVWVKDFISHESILRLFSLTDFYIIFHRHSIFDIAILEAMGYGNVPILSPVGGNLEVIIRDNGLFVDDMFDISGFKKLLSEDIKTLKQKNIALQQELFSDYACLRRYADYIAEYRSKQ